MARDPLFRSAIAERGATALSGNHPDPDSDIATELFAFDAPDLVAKSAFADRFLLRGPVPADHRRAAASVAIGKPADD